VQQHPFANVLHTEIVEKLARGPTLERGRAYASGGRVRAVARKDGQLQGAVQGTSLYQVSIWVSGDGIGYKCTCPAGAEGDFCKHCVALAITWLEVSPRL
jgi:uncharacterized Zn finger protein